MSRLDNPPLNFRENDTYTPACLYDYDSGPPLATHMRAKGRKSQRSRTTNCLTASRVSLMLLPAVSNPMTRRLASSKHDVGRRRVERRDDGRAARLKSERVHIAKTGWVIVLRSLETRQSEPFHRQLPAQSESKSRSSATAHFWETWTRPPSSNARNPI